MRPNIVRNHYLDELIEALRESVKLQSHYAQLLNDYDGGHRLSFDSADAWIKRLRELKEKSADVV